MGNLVGEGFNNYVRRQVNERQKIQGSGVNSLRTPQEISYLNSRNAWLKVASSVLIEDTKLGRERLKRLGLEKEFSPGTDLAKNFILFNGISSLKGNKFREREGIWNPTYNKAGNINNRYKNNALYGGMGPEFGLAPTPGIIGMDIQNINKGSLKSATLTLKAYNKYQLDIIDLLYLRLGFTLLVEWGHSSYVNYKGDITPMGSTITENKFFSDELIGKTYLELLPIIEKKRFETGGNYDAFFGRITNYNWDFQPDGSYNITITLYSLGDVIESLKLNSSLGITTISEDQNYSTTETDLVKRYHQNNKLAAYFMDIRNWNNREIREETFLPRQTEAFKESNIDRIEEEYGQSVGQDTSARVNNNLNTIKLNYDESQKFRELNALILDVNTGEFTIDPTATSQEQEEAKRALLLSNPVNTIIGDKLIPFNFTYKEREIEELELRFYSKEDTELLIENNQGELVPSGFNVSGYGDDPNYIGNILKEKYSGAVTSTGKISYYVKTSTLNEEGGAILNTTKYVVSLDEIGSDEEASEYSPRIFDPNLPLVNDLVLGAGSDSLKESLNIHENNMPPYAIPNDFNIAVSNEKIILEKYDEIIEEEEEINKDFAEKSDEDFKKDTIGNNKDVFYELQQVSTKVKKEIPYGLAINRREGWIKTGLYPNSSLFADHYYAPTKPTDYQYYIRFGTFLGFLRDKQMYQIKSKNPFNPSIIDIDTDVDSNVMYTLPNHVSLDPRVCIVNMNMTGIDYQTQTFKNLEQFQNTEPVYGKVMNIYLTQQFIMESMLKHTDEKGDVYFYNVINTICEGINRSLGGVNNLRPVIDETVNCIKIVDDSSIPNLKEIITYLIEKDPTKYNYSSLTERFKYTKNTLANGDIPYQLDLFGYSKSLPFYNKDNKKDEVFNTSNFIQNVNMRTSVSSELATTLAIGASKAGTVIGIENTPIAKWNQGLTDKIFEQYTTENDNDENPLLSEEYTNIRTRYAQFLLDYWTPMDQLGTMESYPGSSVYQKGTMNNNAIDDNITTGTKFFEYLITSASLSDPDNPLPNASTNGFLPIELEITMDGISGMKIYQEISTNNSFLPNNYPKNLKFVTIGISHKLADNKWATVLKALTQPLTKGKLQTLQLINSIKEIAKTLEQQNLILGFTGERPKGKQLNEGRVAWIQTSSTSTIDSDTKSNNIRLLIQEMNSQGITSPSAQIGLLCVIGKESTFIPGAEKSWGGTGIPRIRDYFSARVAKYSDAELEIIKKDPKKFFDVIYGPEAMSYYINNKGWNPKNDQPGDGYKYRGKGFNQITFKVNYEKFGSRNGYDLVTNPDLMLTPSVAARVGIDFLLDIIERKALPRFGQQYNVNNFNDLNVPAAIYIATVANAGGGKDIRGTETYADAKEVEKYFYILEEEDMANITQGNYNTAAIMGQQAQNNPFSPLRKL